MCGIFQSVSQEKTLSSSILLSNSVGLLMEKNLHEEVRAGYSRKRRLAETTKETIAGIIVSVVIQGKE